MCSAFSAMGAGVPLPLRPEKGYAFELALFGGGTQGKGRERFAPAKGGSRASRASAHPCLLVFRQQRLRALEGAGADLGAPPASQQVEGLATAVADL